MIRRLGSRGPAKFSKSTDTLRKNPRIKVSTRGFVTPLYEEKAGGATCEEIKQGNHDPRESSIALAKIGVSSGPLNAARKKAGWNRFSSKIEKKRVFSMRVRETRGADRGLEIPPTGRWCRAAGGFHSQALLAFSWLTMLLMMCRRASQQTLWAWIVSRCEGMQDTTGPPKPPE